ncbi:Endoribonuclease ToxN [Methanolapillus millepedarum]|uniref:Endoribonuclease ToxN n=2 Tax=Methanolapillus millepedarum TaxID=3028296 RepID=A0AA96VBA7_9EURY|nr:Endoribonuclease ToxN [Methanosarcinaceae archaeon Ac7]
MATDRLSFFTIDSSYCHYLRQFDLRVPDNGFSKTGRPFVGIVFKINDYHYYASLTSPKDKHKNMVNAIDFLKINDGTWGAINFNNMIPVPEGLLTKIDISSLPTNTKEELNYKNLLQNQLSWCNSIKNKSAILKNATLLYHRITKGKPHHNLKIRCCDFIVLEQQCMDYCKFNNISL